jgi:hypothetical protein
MTRGAKTMDDVALSVARSDKTHPKAAAEELVRNAGAAPKLAVLFANRDRDLQGLVRAVRERLRKSTRLVGGTTTCVLDNAGFHPNQSVLGLLGGDFEVGIGVGKGLEADAAAAGAQAIARAASELGRRESDLDVRRHVAMVVDDGLRMKKEELLLGVLEKNPALTCVGGGACDLISQPKPNALVFVDDEVVSDAAAVTVFHTNRPWAALRPHAYQPTGERVTFSKVDDGNKRVLEINGKPAAAEYARVLGVEIGDLEFGKPRGFSARPTALRVGREYFMRSPWMALPDGSIVFVSHVVEGTEVELMKMGDMVDMTRKFFTEELPRRMASPQAVILFNCCGRSWTAHSLGVHDKLGAVMKDAPPAVGLDVWGEIYNAFAIDTTLNVLVFGAGDDAIAP